MRSAFAGKFSEASEGAGLLAYMGIARTDSLDLVNDPRFFSDNVINYRIAAFSTLAVISGLLSSNAIDYVLDMDKHMDWTNIYGLLHFLSFLAMILVLFMNTLATYVGVAQPYHTLRLSTSGALGFEAAASYYLNKNITLWRHISIKAMLWSLPLFVIAQGWRVLGRFEKENKAEMDESELPVDAPLRARVQGWGFCALFMFAGFVMYLVHRMHFSIFNDRYRSLKLDPGFRQHALNMITPTMTTFHRGVELDADV